MRSQKPATIYLVRHGHSTANAKSVLAGRDYKVRLTDIGQSQAQSLAEQLSPIEFAAIYSSPLPRCLETLQPTVSRKPGNKIEELPGVIEMEYGDWSGKKLSLLSRNKLWSTIQLRPSFVRFPTGESFVEMQDRALESVRSMALPGKNILICSHGDVIKAIIAGIVGLHLDSLQRITIDPASISVISLSGDQARLLSINQTSHLGQSPSKKRANPRLNLGGGSGQ